MKDMLQVNGDAGGASVLYDAQVDAQYASLKCDLNWLDPDRPDYKQIASHVIDSQRRGRSIKVHNVFAVRRGEEQRSSPNRSATSGCCSTARASRTGSASCRAAS